MIDLITLELRENPIEENVTPDCYSSVIIEESIDLLSTEKSRRKINAQLFRQGAG